MLLIICVRFKYAERIKVECFYENRTLSTDVAKLLTQ